MPTECTFCNVFFLYHSFSAEFAIAVVVSIVNWGSLNLEYSAL